MLRQESRKWWLLILSGLLFVGVLSITACLDTGGSSDDSDDDEDKYSGKEACANLFDECRSQDQFIDEDQCENAVEDLDRCIRKCMVKESDCDNILACLQASAVRSDYCDSTADGDVMDGDVMDGDVVDGDIVDGDTNSCSGSCNPAMDRSFCIGNRQVCVCEASAWNPYDCNTICLNNGQVLNGCGYNDRYGFDYCLCGDEQPTDGDVTDGDVTDGDVTDGDVTDGDVTDGDVTDGDVTDGDVTDGDVTDGDVTDGDVTDGDDPWGCSGSCNPDTSPGYCSSEDEMYLCACNPDTNRFAGYDCEDICQDGGYDHGAECGAGDDGDVCYCYSGQCNGDSDCSQGEICVTVDGENTCIQECSINTCDGANIIACVDFGAAGSPVGLCLDWDAPTCSEPQAACGTNSGYCYPLQSENLCWDYCTPIANGCSGDQELCLPISDQSGVVQTGGCL